MVFVTVSVTAGVGGAVRSNVTQTCENRPSQCQSHTMKATVAALMSGNDTQNGIIYRLSRRFPQNMRVQPGMVTEAVASITQKGVLLMHRARE